MTVIYTISVTVTNVNVTVTWPLVRHFVVAKNVHGNGNECDTVKETETPKYMILVKATLKVTVKVIEMLTDTHALSFSSQTNILIDHWVMQVLGRSCKMRIFRLVKKKDLFKLTWERDLLGIFCFLLRTGRNIAKEKRGREREKNWAEYFFYFHF